MKKTLPLVFMLVMILCSDLCGQSFIQIRQKSLSEEIATDYTYNVSGGSSYTLSDRPDAVNVILNIAGDGDGGLFAVAGPSEDWVNNPGMIYYKPAGSAVWQNTGSEAFRVQGGNSGGYISLVRSDVSVEPEKTADQIKFRLNSGSSETDITLNLAGERFIAVAHNYDDMLYALVMTGTYQDRNVGTIYKKSVSDVAWVSTGIAGVQSLTALPNTNRVIYAKCAVSDINNVYGADNDNTNVSSYGNPIPLWNDDSVEEMAVTFSESGQLEIWVLSVALIYKSPTPGTWIEEDGINDMRKIASTGGKMLVSVLLDGASENIPYRIFVRAQDGVYLDDERVQTSFNSNSVNIPVTPGTYTITQNPVSGWHITDIRVNEGTTSGTTTSLAGPSATVVVSAGEVVIVEFENQFTTTTNIGQVCGTNFVEDFSSYKNGDWGNPLDGLISYHKATGNFGYGYYAIVSSTDVMSYGDTIFDHTSSDANGSMLLVDATFERGIFYRRRFTGLLAGAKYSFGAWITNFNPPAGDKPNVSFEIYNTSGQLLTSVASGDVLTSQWQNFTTVFTSDGGDIELVLRNNTPRTRGNDLAIDDISFGLSIPSPEASVAFDCTSGTGTLTVASPVSITGSEFEYSIDGGANWQTGTVFSGLAPDSYTVRVRYAGTITGACESTKLFKVLGCVKFNGTVFDDADGDFVMDAGETGTNASDQLYVYLVERISGTIVDAIPVAADGTYTLTGTTDVAYSIQLSAVQYAIGANPAIDHTLPVDWLRIGEGSVTDDGTPDGVILKNKYISSTNVINQNFAIQRPPVADPKSYQVPNAAFSNVPPASYPAVTGYQSIPASSTSLTGYPTGGSLSGSDPEDCSGAGTCNTGTGTTFNIETIKANTKLYYDFGAGPVAIDVTGGAVTIPNFDVTKLVIYGAIGSGTSSDPVGFTYSITDKAGATSTPVTYTIETESPMPVTLISFNARQEGQTVNLNWSTSSEENSKGFGIECSVNASNWSQIGFVLSQSPGTGSDNRLDYVFTDLAPIKGTSYYRLKMVDYDGTFAYSQIRSVGTDKAVSKLTAYPNPVANGKLTVDIPATGLYTAEVHNLAGIRLLRCDLDKNGELNVRGLVAGMYVLRIVSSGGEVQTSTFVIK